MPIPLFRSLRRILENNPALLAAVRALPAEQDLECTDALQEDASSEEAA